MPHSVGLSFFYQYKSNYIHQIKDAGSCIIYQMYYIFFKYFDKFTKNYIHEKNIKSENNKKKTKNKTNNKNNNRHKNKQPNKQINKKKQLNKPKFKQTKWWAIMNSKASKAQVIKC